MRSLVIALIGIVAAETCYAAGPPPLTADYYRKHPEKYLNQKQTLAVAFLTPRNEERADHLRVFDAYTYNLGRSGGDIAIVTRKSTAQKLINVCGTRLQFSGRKVRVTNLQGTFLQEKSDNHGYYFLVP